MVDVNHFGGIVKVLENPKQSFSINNNLMTKFRAQFPQIRNTNIVDLIFWGKLASEVFNSYKVNDYIIIEGYLGLPNKLNSKRLEITVLKVYPLLIRD